MVISATKWFKTALNFLLPSTCLACHAVIPLPGCCFYCQNHLPWLEACCWRCAMPLASPGLCGHCSHKPPSFQRVISPFYYAPPVNSWVMALKFQQQLDLASFLADCLWKKIQLTYCCQEKTWPQLIIPVPLHSKRLAERGFNQALLIAERVAQHSRLAFMRTGIIKQYNTVPQTALSFAARQKNNQHAFAIPRMLPASHIALVDDVLTTGATVAAIASLLRKQGVQRVDVWCVARTVY